MKNAQVIFQPSGKRGEVRAGTTLLEASREMGVGITSICGGTKHCGKCKLKLEEGTFERYGISSRSSHLSPVTEEEREFLTEAERAEGYRLACAAEITGDILISVPEESRTDFEVVKKKASEKETAVKPAISHYVVELATPSLRDPLGDFERLRQHLVQVHGLPSSLKIDCRALQRLPSVLRKGGWKVSVVVWMEQEIIDVRPGQTEEFYGLAIDVGTTTVAGYLCNLRNGRLLATETIMNPQVTYGEDVMSRITYAISQPDGLNTLHHSILEGLNRLVQGITEKTGLTPEDILDVTLVGNTTMHHLLLKIDPEYLGISPFCPAIHRSLDFKARDLALHVHPSAYIHILPIEAGFVGADNVGVLIAEEPHHQDAMVLIIDVGTNGELIVGNRKKLISSSCATGPALEGAHIKFGMRAVPGAIERIKIDPRSFEVTFKVIGKEKWSGELQHPEAKGICGSAIIDGVAEMFRTGLIDKSGRFRKDSQTPRFHMTDGLPEFVIAWKHETAIQKDIVITQKDVRSVQLAKGALYTGAKLMMKKLGLKKLDRVILAGAFGSYIDPEEALILGMFPDCDLNQVVAVGNAAGDGARMALLNRDKRLEAEEIAGKVEYLELTLEDDFQKEFMESMYFPHMTDPFPHLKGIVSD